MRNGIAVGRVLHTKVVTLDTTSKSLAFGFPPNIDTLARLKNIDLDLTADFQFFPFAVAQPELPQTLARLYPRLGEVTGGRFVNAARAA